jgi:peptidoglycan/xylan/chitin deacetylase (PgdA/CDA1 family)
MHQLKGAVRRSLAYVLYYSGMLWLYAAIRLRRRAVVLMYHRVLPADADSYSHEGIVVTPATFDSHMAFLARHFRVLTQEQFKRELAASSFGRRACLVTFDDGWWDNSAYALPVLEKHGIPAICFVATGYLGTDKTFWQERLARLLGTAAGRDGCETELLRAAGLDSAARTDPGRMRRQIRGFVTALKAQDHATVLRLIERLENALYDVPESRLLGADRFMSWDDVRALRRSGLVAIGSHSHTHARLTTLGYEGARGEFEDSRRELARNDIPDVIACAYPNGDANAPVEAAASDSGFALGFGTKSGVVAHSSEAMHLHRINIHEADSRSRPELLYRILGLP